MSVRRLSQSFLSTRGRGKGSTFVAGYGFGVDEMDLLQRVTVGAGGAASISFSSIPQTYQHLQVRFAFRTSSTSAAGQFAAMRFNGDSGSNYAYHDIMGDGATASAISLTSQTSAYFQRGATSTQAANVFGVTVVDILDAFATTKNKVVRGIGGFDSNGSGRAYLYSGLWLSQNAVTSIALTPEAGNFVQHTVASLYGVVG